MNWSSYFSAYLIEIHLFVAFFFLSGISNHFIQYKISTSSVLFYQENGSKIIPTLPPLPRFPTPKGIILKNIPLSGKLSIEIEGLKPD